MFCRRNICDGITIHQGIKRALLQSNVDLIM
jgi:hypothetical protein